MAASMPREVMRRMLERNRQVISDIVLRMDTDALLEMMGL